MDALPPFIKMGRHLGTEPEKEDKPKVDKLSKKKRLRQKAKPIRTYKFINN